MRRIAIAVLAPAVLAVACGGAPGDADEVLTAEPYPREVEAYPLEDDPEADAADTEKPAQGGLATGGDDTAEGADDDVTEEDLPGPRPADAAAYVQQHLPPDALDHDVLLVDEPAQGPRLLLAVVTDDRRGVLEAARWNGDGFEHVLRLDAGPAKSLGTLRTPRVGDERLVALGLRHDGELRIAVWHLEEARLTVPEACPVQEPREIRRQGTTVEIGCDARAGAEDRLVWHDGAFRSPEVASRGDARPKRPERVERPETSDRSERPQRQGPPDHAEASPRGQQGQPDAPGGRSDAGDGPRSTQGGGHRGR